VFKCFMTTSGCFVVVSYGCIRRSLCNRNGKKKLGMTVCVLVCFVNVRVFCFVALW